MDENLQNIDELFNRAYSAYEDDPSATAWEKLNAALDKEDAEKYKRRFIGWKRIAVVLLFLLAGFIIYEAGVVIKPKKDYEQAKKKESADSTFVAGEPPGFQKKETITDAVKKDADKSVTNDRNTDKIESSNVLLEIEQKDTFQFNIKQGTNTANEQQEITVATQPVRRHVKTKPNDRTKLTIKPITITQDDIEGTAAIEIKRNKSDLNINKGKDSLRRIIMSPISSIARIDVTRPSVIVPDLKPLALLKINTTSEISKSKTKKAASSFKPYWSVTAFGSNDWAQYKLDNDVQDNTGNQQDEKEEIGQRERHEASFSAGVLATRQFSKHLGLKAGLIYSSTAIGISPQEMYAAKQRDGSIAYKYITSSGYGFVKPGFGLPPAVGDSIQSTEAQHNLQMISVPLMISYRFEKNKFSVSPAVGLSANFITNANVKTEVTDALNKEAVTINGLDGMRDFYTGLVADVNVQYNLNNKWSFSLLPTFKYAITPITRSNVVKTFPYNFNIGAGITYKF